MGSVGKYKKKIIVTDEKSTPEARGARLKRLRGLAGLTRDELCSLGNININTLKGWEIGKYGGLPLDQAKNIIQVISTQKGVQCTLEWLVHEVGVGPSVNTDYWKISEERKVYEVTKKPTNVIDNENKLILNEVILFRKQFINTIDFLIDDDGMEPFYEKDEYVAGVKYYGDDIDHFIGQDCIVQLASGETMVRNLRGGSEKGKYNLFCVNIKTTAKSPVLTDIKLASVAPILRCFRRMKLPG